MWLRFPRKGQSPNAGLKFPSNIGRSLKRAYDGSLRDRSRKKVSDSLFEPNREPPAWVEPLREWSAQDDGEDNEVLSEYLIENKLAGFVLVECVQDETQAYK